MDGRRQSTYSTIMEVSMFYHSIVDRMVTANFEGFPRTSIHALCALDTYGALSMGRLATVMNTSKEQVSRTIKSLEGKGLVLRNKSADNHRIVYASLSEEGKDLMDCMHKSLVGDFEGLFAKVDAGDIDDFTLQLAGMHDILRRMMDIAFEDGTDEPKVRAL